MSTEGKEAHPKWRSVICRALMLLSDGVSLDIEPSPHCCTFIYSAKSIFWEVSLKVDCWKLHLISFHMLTYSLLQHIVWNSRSPNCSHQAQKSLSGCLEAESCSQVKDPCRNTAGVEKLYSFHHDHHFRLVFQKSDASPSTQYKRAPAVRGFLPWARESKRPLSLWWCIKFLLHWDILVLFWKSFNGDC